jgi:hypothetical protein
MPNQRVAFGRPSEVPSAMTAGPARSRGREPVRVDARGGHDGKLAHVRRPVALLGDRDERVGRAERGDDFGRARKQRADAHRLRHCGIRSQKTKPPVGLCSRASGHISPAGAKRRSPVRIRRCPATAMPLGDEPGRPLAPNERQPSEVRAVRAAAAARPPPPPTEEVFHQRTLSRVATPAGAAPERKCRNACDDPRAVVERRQGLGARSLEVAPRAARA